MKMFSLKITRNASVTILLTFTGLFDLKDVYIFIGIITRIRVLYLDVKSVPIYRV